MNRRRRIAVSALGAFAGLGGATHGPGEMLQGNVVPDDLFIKAWPALTALDGEPAMTVLPTYLAAGIVTVIVGVVVALWAVRYVERRNGGAVLALLSLLLLLVGGGLIPPLFGIAAGAVGMWTERSEARRDARGASS